MGFEIYFWRIVLFSFGLIFGSFINVIVFRYREDRFLFGGFLGGRSYCPRCKKKLRWYELVPLFSFIIQLGHCRHCSKKISWRYPIIELLTGLLFLTPIYFYYYFQINQQVLAGNVLVWYYWLSGIWLLAGMLMIALSVIDWRLYLIPDEAIIGIALLGILAATLKFYYQELIGWKVSFLGSYSDLVNLPVNLFWNHLLAGLIGAVFFGLIFAVTKGRGMGFGDVKLAGALGLLMGWPDVALAFVFAFMIGSVWGLFLLAGGLKKFKEPLPFGPFIIMGVFAVVFFGYQIVDWYFKLFWIFS